MEEQTCNDVNHEKFSESNMRNRNKVSKKDTLKQFDKEKHKTITSWKSLHWSCHYCEETFNDFIVLQTHLQLLHELESNVDVYYQCYDCREHLFGYASFLNHIRGLHYEALKLCCDVCNEISPDYEQLAIHRDKHIGKRSEFFPTVYHCTLCDEVHSTEKILKNHIQQTHSLVQASSEKTDDRLDLAADVKNENCVGNSFECKVEYEETQQIFQCGECVQNFSTAGELKTHINVHYDDIKYEIYEINFNTDKDQQIEKRTPNRHSPDYAFICEICKKVFKRSYALTVHMREHNNEVLYNCYICEQVFNDKTDLANHVRLHTEERPFKCDKCLKTFKHKIYLNKHTCLEIKETSFKCDICKREFSKKSALNTHMYLHKDERPFKCLLCTKRYAHKSSLRDHMNIHTEDCAYKCHVCNKVFGNSSNLKSHSIIHTERFHKCEICDRKFVNKTSLNNHKLTHSGENAFVCEICKKVFCSLASLKFHMHTHTGDSSYKCNVCGKKFISNSKLKCHKSVHTNKRPIKCEICCRKFKEKRYLQQHRKICPRPE